MLLHHLGKRLLALPLFTCIALVIFYVSSYLSFSALQQHYHQLQHWKDQHLVLSMVAMTLIYTITVCFSIPGTAILTIFSGLVFGIPIGLFITILRPPPQADYFSLPNGLVLTGLKPKIIAGLTPSKRKFKAAH